MNEHRAIRTGDEWQCPKCGKAWHIQDDDVPPCEPTEAYQHSRLDEIKMEATLPFLEPRSRWLINRLSDIDFAIDICLREKITIPNDWITERYELITHTSLNNYT